MDFAVIQTGGKQYKVKAGDKLKVEKLGVASGDKVKFDKVLLWVEGGKTEIGAPYLDGKVVEADVLGGEVKDRKKIVFKYHSKTRRRTKKGHRQIHTEVVIK
jgi:large subunit ribosomal protein L21